jgi:hypothetical protein
MTKFSWGGPDRRPPLVVEGRFGELPGSQAWEDLVGIIANPEAPDRELFDAFDDFLRAIDLVDRNLVKDCAFISHRQSDWSLAKDVARVVTNTGRDYWLDIHDPTLQWANKKVTSLGSVAGAILLAAIIEIALLNSTHVIALHTVNSAGSAWIPYELGRAKARKIFSSQAAGWFVQPILPSSCAEYIHLAQQTLTLQDIENWLMKRGRYA